MGLEHALYTTDYWGIAARLPVIIKLDRVNATSMTHDSTKYLV